MTRDLLIKIVDAMSSLHGLHPGHRAPRTPPLSLEALRSYPLRSIF